MPNEFEKRIFVFDIARVYSCRVQIQVTIIRPNQVKFIYIIFMRIAQASMWFAAASELYCNLDFGTGQFGWLRVEI